MPVTSIKIKTSLTISWKWQMSYVSLFPNFSKYKTAWEDLGLILVLKGFNLSHYQSRSNLLVLKTLLLIQSFNGFCKKKSFAKIFGHTHFNKINSWLHNNSFIYKQKFLKNGKKCPQVKSFKIKVKRKSLKIIKKYFKPEGKGGPHYLLYKLQL